MSTLHSKVAMRPALGKPDFCKSRSRKELEEDVSRFRSLLPLFSRRSWSLYKMGPMDGLKDARTREGTGNDFRFDFNYSGRHIIGEKKPIQAIELEICGQATLAYDQSGLRRSYEFVIKYVCVYRKYIHSPLRTKCSRDAIHQSRTNIHPMLSPRARRDQSGVLYQTAR